MKSTEEHMAILLQKGDVSALSLIFDCFGARLYHMSYTYIKSQEEAEETVQDVLLKLWQNRQRVDPTQSLEGYVFKIAKNLLLNKIRKRATSKVLIKETSYGELPGGISADEHLLGEEMEDFLAQVIQRLPEKRRAIFTMSRLEGFSHKEIAVQLRIKEKTVENQISRAIKFIKSYLS